MTFKSGQSVIFVMPKDGKIPAYITTMVVARANKTDVYMQGEEFPRYAAFIYPDTPACREFLKEGIEMNARHRKEEDEYMRKTYQFNNQLVRDGLK